MIVQNPFCYLFLFCNTPLQCYLTPVLFYFFREFPLLISFIGQLHLQYYMSERFQQLTSFKIKM